MKVYFDNAATTPMNSEVIEMMTQMMREEYGNPSSTHAHGRIVRTHVEEARKKVASLLNCSPGEIFFTSGGTEADNMAIRKSVLDLGVKNIISSAIEHHAVSHTIEEVCKKGEVKSYLVNLLPNGHIDLLHLENLLQNNANTLVCLMHANNEIGNMIDIDKVAQLCSQYNALLQCDTVQTMGHYAFDLVKTPVTFLACGAHKFNGPKGVGFIYINSKLRITPLITGGSQERNMRGGTENVYGIVGLAKALEISCANLDQDKLKIQSLKSYMMNELKKHIPGVLFNGDPEGSSLYTVLSVNFPPTPIAEMMLFKLDIAGISASGGSACSSGSNVGSHVLTALNIGSDRPCIRFSFGKQNTQEEVDYVVTQLCAMLKINQTQSN
ncbi:MAG: cysteine desulfurase family protein [bacterium]|nr:cysteine desulfurase family protein [bacterium]